MAVMILALLILIACASPAPAPQPTAVSPTVAARQGAAIIVAATAVPTVPPAPAVAPVRVRLESAAPTVGSSAPTNVNIVLEGVKNLYGAEVHLLFDPTLLQQQDADTNLPGNQFVLGSSFNKSSSFVALNKADNQVGTADFAVTLLNPAPALEGRVVLATLRFLAVKAGTATVRCTQVILANREGQALPNVCDEIKLEARP
jgi:hypothetical protein